MAGQLVFVCFVAVFTGYLVAADVLTAVGSSITVKSALGPVVVQNYTSLGAIALSSKQSTQCSCQGKFTKITKVCGTNNITYGSICQLNFAMKLNKNLGLRCNKACPNCPNYAKQATKAGGCDAKNQLTSKIAKKKLPKTNNNLIKVFCMNDGTEETRGTVFCRLANNATLGVRCGGSCSEFATYNCPARLMQDIPKYA